MISPETLTLIKEGGVPVLLMIAIAWLVMDRNRILKALGDKDEEIADKNDKLVALSERTIVTMTEFKALLQSVVDIFNTTKRR
jgi:hypothetical protein